VLRRGDGLFRCSQCGAVLDNLSDDEAANATFGIDGTPDGTERVLSVRGVEVHRCPTPSRKTVPNGHTITD
jgi:hypothetical protein